MAIDYQPLYKTMKENGVSWYQMQQEGIDNKTCQQLRDNKNITLETLEKLCDILSCTPNDIVQFTKNNND